jgi:hypothetical protein
MNAPTSLVGRDAELGRIAAAFSRAREGSGGTILLDGEAGIGKSRLAREAAESSDGSVLSAAAVDGSPPYGPIAEALRTWTRPGHDSCPADAPLRPHLALLLPELGDPAESSDKATIFEAVRCALAYISEKGPAILLLDDLQWSDETTLELLAALAPHLDEMPVLAILAYRSDGLARDHRLRWLRNELRRGGLLDEISLEPLDRDRVAGLLAGLLGNGRLKSGTNPARAFAGFGVTPSLRRAARSAPSASTKATAPRRSALMPRKPGSRLTRSSRSSTRSLSVPTRSRRRADRRLRRRRSRSRCSGRLTSAA